MLHTTSLVSLLHACRFLPRLDYPRQTHTHTHAVRALRPTPSRPSARSQSHCQVFTLLGGGDPTPQRGSVYQELSFDSTPTYRCVVPRRRFHGNISSGAFPSRHTPGFLQGATPPGSAATDNDRSTRPTVFAPPPPPPLQTKLIVADVRRRQTLHRKHDSKKQGVGSLSRLSFSLPLPRYDGGRSRRSPDLQQQQPPVMWIYIPAPTETRPSPKHPPPLKTTPPGVAAVAAVVASGCELRSPPRERAFTCRIWST